MLTPERHQIILNLLKEKQNVTIHELVEVTSSSDSTIRRDLSQLENENYLKRVHGGAVYMKQKGEELSISEKSTKYSTEKQAIGRYAAQLVEDGDCIFLDAGTTTMQMIPFLREKDIVVVTNGLSHVEWLSDYNIKTYLTGGFIKGKTRALIGQKTMESIGSYRFDKCFLGANGFHPEHGYTTPDPEEAEIKKLALSLSQEQFMLADNSKLHEVTFARISSLDKATLVTNTIPQKYEEILKEKTNVKVVSS
ncbi:DeoR/GlpR family DNA-binding transcription regulator [Salirhabdus salicampi]|uniref:DeoR/GlpR family DNA-binding transcription regulator n=1 Tax=Salirhabdus salicampi TaxID=476102 RepID=UPI0020C35EB1|nr:DeoR/GlpR family DNA-binding transcription regulator [Salirhabdus salicampi]MCP8617660.1 DeoR/GlpR family DNA-binding transcription regulator [Salirhabdus salicampi]